MPTEPPDTHRCLSRPPQPSDICLTGSFLVSIEQYVFRCVAPLINSFFVRIFVKKMDVVKNESTICQFFTAENLVEVAGTLLFDVVLRGNGDTPLRCRGTFRPKLSQIRAAAKLASRTSAAPVFGSPSSGSVRDSWSWTVICMTAVCGIVMMRNAYLLL